MTRTIDETWRMSFEGKVYDIKGVMQVGRRNAIRIEAVAADTGL